MLLEQRKHGRPTPRAVVTLYPVSETERATAAKVEALARHSEELQQKSESKDVMLRAMQQQLELQSIEMRRLAATVAKLKAEDAVEQADEAREAANLDSCEIGRTVWDAPLLLGVAQFSSANCFLIRVLAIFNIVFQLFFVGLLAFALIEEEFTSESIASFRSWRLSVQSALEPQNPWLMAARTSAGHAMSCNWSGGRITFAQTSRTTCATRTS